MRAYPQPVEALENRLLLAQVAGFAFVDDGNGFGGPNGIRDDGELAAGVRLVLFDAGPNRRTGGGDDKKIAETTTAADGSYSFTGLPASTYVITVDRKTIPAGFVIGIPDFLGNNTRDSDFSPKFARTNAFTLGAQGQGEQSVGFVAANTPATLIITRNGQQLAENPTINLTDPADRPEGTPTVGDDVLVSFRVTNIGLQPYTVSPPDTTTKGLKNGGLLGPRSDPQGRGWNFVTELAGKTFKPYSGAELTLRYRTDVPGQFGGAGRLVPAGGNPATDAFNLPNVTGFVVGGAVALPKRPAPGTRNLTFTATYGVDNGVAFLDETTLGDGDVEVTGPRNFRTLAKFVSADTFGNSNGTTATYTIRAPGKKWDKKDKGTYRFTIRKNEVIDQQGNVIAPTVVRRIKYNFDTPSAGRRAATAPLAPSALAVADNPSGRRTDSLFAAERLILEGPDPSVL